MRVHTVKARDLPDAWFQCVDLCHAEGRDYTITEGSYVGQRRRELDYVTVHITHPQTRPLLPDIPAHFGIPNPVEDDYVEKYLPYLLTADKRPNEQYTYGQRLFGEILEYEETDDPKGRLTWCMPQVEEVIKKFKKGFGDNQACMTIAQPSDIHLTDPPCMRQIDCRIYPESGARCADERRLHFCVYFRSWDLWAGFPANLAAIVYLQEHMALEIGVEPGEIVAASKGLHLYDHFWELARVRLGEAG